MDAITLFDLNSRVRQTLKERFAEAVWITAEIADVKENRSGHCYLELADKKEEDESVIAVARGIIWSFTYKMLRPYFETSTGRGLEKGMKVLLQVEVVFHELYGYSLNIKDIDPTFTVGDLERKKREILAQLENDGIINMNKELEMPLVPKTVAVISSPTAAGYGDFMNHLQNNPYGYKFHVKLFPAVMQGERTTESVIGALERIYEYESLFDVVVIIRGGGAQTDLGSFDSYDMAANVAQFPLPVIAGIGHERDDTIVDRVAYMKVKTPTAAAAFLIDAFQETEARLDELQGDFTDEVEDLLASEQTRQRLYMSDFKRLTQSVLENNRNKMRLLSQQLEHGAKLYVHNRNSGFEQIRSRINNRVMLLLERQGVLLNNLRGKMSVGAHSLFVAQKSVLELAEAKIRFADPKNVLERGYSITRVNGQAVRDAANVKEGDTVETVLYKGRIKSIVTDK